MKNANKSLPIIISSIVLVVMIAVPLIFFNSYRSVAISGSEGSYAETFAKENNLEYFVFSDSENDDVAIPSATATDSNGADAETTTAVNEDETQPAEKENDLFTYNYNGNTVTITGYKGYSPDAVIPSEIDGLPVTAINMNAVKDGISTLTIPASVTSIEGTFKTAPYSVRVIVALIIICLAYVFSVIATLTAFKKNEDSQGTALSIPTVYGGVFTLILIGVWCNVCLFALLSWIINVIVSLVIFAFAIARLFMRRVAKEKIIETDEKVKDKTFFIKEMRTQAKNIVDYSGNENAKAAATKVYEALRYSDPTADGSSDEAQQLVDRMNVFAGMVKTGTDEDVKTCADDILTLISFINNKTKSSK